MAVFENCGDEFESNVLRNVWTLREYLKLFNAKGLLKNYFLALNFEKVFKGRRKMKILLKFLREIGKLVYLLPMKDDFDFPLRSISKN